MKAKRRQYKATLFAYNKGQLVKTVQGWNGLQKISEHHRPRTMLYIIGRWLMPDSDWSEQYDPYNGLEYDRLEIKIDIKEIDHES